MNANEYYKRHKEGGDGVKWTPETMATILRGFDAAIGLYGERELPRILE